MGLFSRIFGKGNVNERKAEPAIIFVSGEDEQMLWAIEKARLTLWYFEQNLKEPLLYQEYFSVKIRMENGEHIEHIWLTDPEFDTEGNLFGTIGNEPSNIKSVKLGDRIGVERSVVSDWMIRERGRLIGGYTIRALRDTVSEDDKIAFDESLGLKIDEGADHFKANLDTPEGALLAIEQAFTEKNLDRVLACKDFHAEAYLMLSKLKFEVDQDIIDTTAEALEASFMQYLDENGMPDFSNKISVFTHREKVTEQYWIITEICIYNNGYRSVERSYTYKSDNGWKVLNTV